MTIIDTYQEIEMIKETDDKRITVVKSEIDHLIYIKRELKNDNEQMYQQIKNLNSKYFPKIYHIEKQERKIIIIEELINAPTLDTILLNNHISKQEAISIYIQVCKATKQLHECNPAIIHRDIKPENIFYDSGKIYLFDFDISRNFNLDKNKDTHILGSQGYAAPEQFGFRQSDQRSDIYALGVLLNVLLTKKLPSEEMCKTKEKHIIEKAISLDPEKRYQTIDELLQEFKIKKATKLTQYINEYIKTIPGFRNTSIIKKILALAGYVLLTVLSFSIEIEGKPTNGLTIYVYRVFMWFMFLTLIFIIGNYRNLQDRCLFSTNENKYVRYTGIFLTCWFVMLGYASLIAFIVVIFKLN